MQNTPLEQLDKKHFAKGNRGSDQNGSASAARSGEDAREIALMEVQVGKICDLLDEVSYISLVFSSITLTVFFLKKFIS